MSNTAANERLLATLSGADPLKKLESAYRLYHTTFLTPDVKRLYLRFFETTALQVHFVEVVARVEPALGAQTAEKCEHYLEQLLVTFIAHVDKSIDQAALLMQQNGLTEQVNYIADGLEVNVRVTSPIMRNYLKLMEKTEQLIGLLETLRIDGVMTTHMCDTRRGQLKGQLKTFAMAARRLTRGLRRRLQAVQQAAATREAAAACAAPSAAHHERPEGEPDASSAEQIVLEVTKRYRNRLRGVSPPRNVGQKQRAAA